MFSIAFLIGVYANIIFFLGLANLLTNEIIWGFTAVYIFLSVIFWHKFDEPIIFSQIKKEILTHIKENILWVLLITITFGIVLLGALGPELAFDALWYHLTLPKIYLQENGIRFIPGGLLYYSTMPKLGEMLFTGALALSSEIGAKLIHMSFLVLTSIAIYCIAKRYVSMKYALIAVVIFLSNIVVLWEATTAYIDLIRTFFEIMAVWGLHEYINTQKKKWLVESAFLMGLAISTKLLAIGTLVIMLALLLGYIREKNFIEKSKVVLLYSVLALLVPLPWFVFSYVHTGNPFYPIFSGYQVHIGQDTLALPGILIDPIMIFLNASDPLSPIYLMLAPLLILFWKKIPRSTYILFLYAALGLLIWTLTPRTGGGRFILVYLPVFSLCAAVLLSSIQKTRFSKITLLAVVITSITALVYRGVATTKYLPVILGQEKKQEFLQSNLNFQFGDFIDVNNEIAEIVGERRVLLYGFHNLYYVNFPFIHESWVQKGDTFTYIATQNASLPERFRYWMPIYTNPTTGVTLYTTGREWIY